MFKRLINYLLGNPTERFYKKAKNIVKVFDDTIVDLNTLNSQIEQQKMANTSSKIELEKQLLSLQAEEIELVALSTRNENVIGKIKTLLS